MMTMIDGSTDGRRATALALTQGGALVPPTLLGRSATRKISVDGRIRAGIMVLTKKAEASAEARALYDAGLAAGKSFDRIGREISEKVAELARPLTPKNVPYFTVRGEDFPNPTLAEQIMAMFGEDRGDGVRRLYRFPVVFPADVWQHVMPHEMVAWRANERAYWSEYSADGQTRYCKTYEAVPLDREGRRAIRIFGGRKTVLRQENGGVCDPEACPDYQKKACNLSGRFIFFIPGIRSISAFDLPTNSFYAMQSAIEKFQTIGFMRGGRIAGFLDGSRTPFFVTKRLVDVSRINDEGQAVRTPQWLIELEAPIDPTALLRGDDGMEAVDARAAESAGRLEGRDVIAADDDGVIAREDKPAVAMPRASTRSAGMDCTERHGSSAATPWRAPAVSTALPQGDRRAAVGAGDAPEVGQVLAAAQALGISAERYQAYADKRFGKGWKVAASGRKRALDEIAGFGGDARSFGEKVRGEEIFN